MSRRKKSYWQRIRRVQGGKLKRVAVGEKLIANKVSKGNEECCGCVVEAVFGCPAPADSVARPGCWSGQARWGTKDRVRSEAGGSGLRTLK